MQPESSPRQMELPTAAAEGNYAERRAKVEHALHCANADLRTVTLVRSVWEAVEGGRSMVLTYAALGAREIGRLWCTPRQARETVTRARDAGLIRTEECVDDITGVITGLRYHLGEKTASPRPLPYTADPCRTRQTPAVHGRPLPCTADPCRTRQGAPEWQGWEEDGETPRGRTGAHSNERTNERTRIVSSLGVLGGPENQLTASDGAVSSNVQGAPEFRVTVAEVTTRDFPPRALADVSALAIQVIARLWPDGRTSRLPGDEARRLSALSYLALAFYSPQALLEAAAAARRQRKNTIRYTWAVVYHEAASRLFLPGTPQHDEAMKIFAWRSNSIVKERIKPPWDPPEWPEYLAASQPRAARRHAKRAR